MDMSNYQHAEDVLLRAILAGEKNVDNRTVLGPMVPVRLFQALRLIALGTSMEEMVGDGARALVYQSGQRVGQILGKAVVPAASKDLDKYIELVRNLGRSLSIGLVVPEKIDLSEGRLTLRMDECVSCAGISGATAPICQFEAGLLGGIVRAFVERDVRATETRCNAVGDKTCAVDVQILGV